MTNENENIIIGHLLRFPELAMEIAEALEPEDFSSPQAGATFRAILEHSGNGYDALSITNSLKALGFNVSVSDLLTLQEFAFDGVDLDRIKAEIKAESGKRTLASYLKTTLHEIQKPGSDLPEITDDLSKKLLNLQAGVTTEKILKRPADFRAEILDPKGQKAMLTGLESFDDLLGGLRSHELTVFTGETSSGKTTFAAAFLPYALSQKGHPGLIASFEMKPPQIQRKWVQMTMGRPFGDLTRTEKEQGLDFVEELPLHFVDAYGQMGLRELKGALFRAHKQFGVELAILDHLHFFLKYAADHERQAIDAALVEIKTWAMTLGLHIILVVHPTKLESENKPVSMNNLKGSSGLKQIPDNIFSLWRSRKEDDLKKPESEVVLYVLKCRDDSGDEGSAILTFDKRSQVYADSGPGERPPVEGRGFSRPSPRPEPGRDWSSGYDN